MAVNFGLLLFYYFLGMSFVVLGCFFWSTGQHFVVSTFKSLFVEFFVHFLLFQNIVSYYFCSFVFG